MNFDEIRRRAAVVREVPLETVLILRGAVRDRQDRSKWHTERGPLSVTGPRFMSWHRGTGGGGAIDLVMHLAGVDFQAAVAWLQQNVAGSHVMVGKDSTTKDASRNSRSVGKRDVDSLRLPARDDRMLSRVRRYLAGQRYLPASLTEPLIASGKIYADSRSNAVFLLVRGKANRPNCAEPGVAFGEGWRQVRVRTWVISGSVPRDLGKSFSANPRSTRSAASIYTQTASASPPRVCEPILAGWPD